MFFRSDKKRAQQEAQPAPSPAATAVVEEAPGELESEIARLTEEVRARPDADAERRLLRLRHKLGILQLDGAEAERGLAEPGSPPARVDGIPEVDASELSAASLRAAMLDGGCLRVRGLVARDEALAIADEIEQALQAWQAAQDGAEVDPGLYEDFIAEPPFQLVERNWVNSAGGIWTADSPRLMCRVVDLFGRTGLTALARDYLGEQPLLSVQKGTLRKVDPSAGRGWHQDGAFLGHVKALNVWISLSRCGDESPGMDLIPKRLDQIVETGTRGATFNWSVAEEVAQETAGDTAIVRPIFEPGDVLLFDEMFLHTTAADPSMPNPRFAIETWFFGASAYPDNYVPVAL